MYDDVVAGILSVIPEKIEQIILYGSVARGDDTPESDIDIALITQEPLDFNTKNKISYAVADFDLKYGRIFSTVKIDKANFLKWKSVMPFYRNIEKEGILLWSRN